MTDIDFVFEARNDTPSLTFVEVESPPGKSIRFGTWVKRDGYDVLRVSLFTLTEIREALDCLKWEDRQHVFDRLGLTPYQREQE